MQTERAIDPTASKPTHAELHGRDLPLDTRFKLSEAITQQQREFLEHNGYLVFSQVASPEEVEQLIAEGDRIEREWLAEGREKIFGIPLFKGLGPDGEPRIQRLPFTSCHSDFIRDLVRDQRFAPIRSLVGSQTRVGDQEKDGVVMNRYFNAPGTVYGRLGWHTDGLRDLFYLRVPQQMLNVGLHLDRIRKEDGGLRVIPGSHKQGFVGFLTKKAYFVSHKADPDEVVIETEPGDLTVHDGRCWHRVEASPHHGMRSLRRSMYVPYLTDEYQPKHEGSKTPAYHYLAKAARMAKLAWVKRRNG